MLEQKDIRIGSTPFVIQQLPATRCMEVGIHLLHVVMGAAEGIGSIIDNQEFFDSEFNPAQMAAGVLKRINERETPIFIKALIKESLISPDPGDDFSDWYEMHFSANMIDIFDIIAAIIEHNKYADLVKKRMADVMGILSSDVGMKKASTPTS